jgi:hypothetical protein
LRARRRDVPAVPSPIGDWFFFDEPAACPPAPPPDAADADARAVVVDRLVYVPETEMLGGEGSAADRTAGLPFAALAIDAGDGAAAVDVEYGIVRHDVASAALAPSGWRMTTRIPIDVWNERRRAGRLAFVATSADGRVRRVTVPLARADVLPPLDPPWTDVRARMRTAEADGRADRARGCGARRGQPCVCEPTGAVR